MPGTATTARDAAGPGRWAVLVGAVLVWYAAALVGGVVGVSIGILVPCDEPGFECLGRPFGWGMGLGLGAVLLLWPLMRRSAMASWWIPASLLLLLVGGILLMRVDAAWPGLAVVLSAPVLAGLLALPARGGQRRRGVALGVIVLTGLIVLALGTSWSITLADRREVVAQVEATGLTVFAPADREGLEVGSVRARPGGGEVVVSFRKEGDHLSWSVIETAPSREPPCHQDNRSCTDMGDGITVVARERAPETDFYVTRELDDHVVRIAQRGRTTIRGWTDQEYVELARDLVPVDPRKIVREARDP